MEVLTFFSGPQFRAPGPRILMNLDGARSEWFFSDLEKQGQNFNLEAEYEKIREQVESGEIKITPPSP